MKKLVSEGFPEEKKAEVDDLWLREVEENPDKIIVLDDDPTGTQTVHGVNVYTDWSLESIQSGFEENGKLFFLLTNSRAFTEEETTRVHREIGERICQAARETDREYIVISRGDSTLRGHYPLETQVLKETMENCHDQKLDGEIFCPYFGEGKRFTVGDIHYVKHGKTLVPAGETEFSRDKTFGYHASNLCDYIEEKTDGQYPAGEVISISLERLRTLDWQWLEQQLMSVRKFGKIVVNAIDDYDVKVFCIALYRAIKWGKHFMLRTAASMVKIMGGIGNQPLLNRSQMLMDDGSHGGIIVIGSHTEKTTAQLEELKHLPGLEFIEIDTKLVFKDGKLLREVKQLTRRCDTLIKGGRTVVAYTGRTLLIRKEDTKEEALMRSVKISDAVQTLVGGLTAAPAFVVAKGGITSSDIGIKALNVKCADVLGQIQPGVPVWRTGRESRFPGIPFVIFPGNVGDYDTLRKVTEILWPQALRP